MNEIIELTNVDFSSIFLAVFMILFGIKSVVSLFEWIIRQLGLETKWMRTQRKERELLMQTSQNLSALQKRHDEEIRQSMMRIENLMIAQREILADKINEKYKYYISIKGIPEDEVEEFTNLHTAYQGVGGNHSGDAKYEYCINHLSVIPVETTLIVNNGGFL